MSKSHSDAAGPDRRGVVLGGAALLGAAVLPGAAAGAPASPLGPAVDLLAGARKLLSGLDPDQRKAASFGWNGPEWKQWNYFGSGDNIKPGLRLEQMSAVQKAAAWDLLATLFSPVGIEKTRNVMTLQEVLASLGNAPGNRSPERFSFAFFGTPAETGAWGFRLEGHHLSQSIAVRDGNIIAVTPSSFSVNPNRVGSGKYAGLVTLKNEEALARRLAGDLVPKQLDRARLSERTLDNILSYAGRERANAKKVGVAAADLVAAQRDLLWELIETYTVEYLAAPLATAQKARVHAGDPEAVHFAWYGPNTAEKSFGYRVIADGFVIELGSVDLAAQHLHTIYHDLGTVLGRKAA